MSPNGVSPGPGQWSKRELRDLYDELAPRYDALQALPEWLGVRRLRSQLLKAARGTVLEVGVGTGQNLDHYPPDCRVTAIDLSHGMLRVARRRGMQASFALHLARADTERLPFADASFDTVVDTLTLCTYPEPVEALREMARVCRPDGAMLLLEHGRSDHGWLAWFQDHRADQHCRAHGCHWNRKHVGLVREAGLRIHEMQRSFFGVFQVITASSQRITRGGADPRREPAT